MEIWDALWRGFLWGWMVSGGVVGVITGLFIYGAFVAGVVALLFRLPWVRRWTLDEASVLVRPDSSPTAMPWR